MAGNRAGPRRARKGMRQQGWARSSEARFDFGVVELAVVQQRPGRQAGDRLVSDTEPIEPE